MTATPQRPRRRKRPPPSQPPRLEIRLRSFVFRSSGAAVNHMTILLALLLVAILGLAVLAPGSLGALMRFLPTGSAVVPEVAPETLNGRVTAPLQASRTVAKQLGRER